MEFFGGAGLQVWHCGAALGAGGCLVVGVRHLRRVGAARRRLQELLATVAGQDARIVVTGATSGIGEELARQLARHPSVSLLLGCRDVDRAHRLFRAQQGSTKIVKLELLDFDSVESFASEVNSFLNGGGPGLRLLVNNAGVMRPPPSLFMATGSSAPVVLDPTWQTNFLSPFLLTELLAHRRAVAAGESKQFLPVQVVHVSSRLERRSKLDEGLLEEVSEGRPGNHTYSDSKRALMLWTSVRAQGLASKSSLYVHASTPGMVDSQLGRYSVRPWLWPLTKPLRMAMLRSPAEGALAACGGALQPSAAESYGRYFDGEKELEDLVAERTVGTEFFTALVKWATRTTGLETRAGDSGLLPS